MFGTNRPRRTINAIHTQTPCLHHHHQLHRTPLRPLQMLATSSTPQDNDDKDVDIWRHTMLRYLGYTNELGESFRPIFPKLVVPSYVVSFGYVFCDTADKTIKAQKEAEQLDPRVRTLHVVESAVDTLVWQSLASVIIPGITIHKIVDVTCDALAGKYSIIPVKNVPPALQRWGPTVVGLATIPLVIHPLDNFVHFLLDATMRPVFGYAAYRLMQDEEHDNL
jgi:fission process protein 1